MNKIILSIKPCFTDKIYSGEKPVELRKRVGKLFTKGSRIYIYSSSPVKAITGYAEIDSVQSTSIAIIKKRSLSLACISEPDFDDYFEGKDSGVMIWLKNIKQYKSPLPLAQLRLLGFTPPQSFSYASPKLKEALLEVR
jgi:predicted transcriptional regulator